MIAGGVVLFHVAALWALQTGLLRRAVEVIVPAQILAEMITPPAPKVEVPPAPAPTPPVPKPKVKAPPPPPMPVAIADPTPAPNAPTGVVAPQPAPAPIAAPVAAAPSPPAPPAPPKIELPSSEASYLQNPAPVYPAMSKRLQEQGKVIVRVMIGVDGQPQNASVRRSSGFERLDRAAVEYVMKCRYVPGKVAGVAQAMWYDAPVNFELTF
jgi:periplasmic protein TonB